jgi:ABC-type multidrug transport system ATPase subunit
MTAVEMTGVSRWYGNVVAVNDVTLTVGPGVTGLLGPNGAGKTTVLHMIAGLLNPSQGTVLVGGAPSWRNPQVYRTLGLVTEHEGVPGFLTARNFVLASAKLHRLADPEAATRRAWTSSSSATRHCAGSPPIPRECANGPGSRRHWCTIPKCWCWTNRSTASTHASACT